MPILDSAAQELNTKLGAATEADAQKFAPGAPIDAGFVYPGDMVRRQALQGYIDTMPAGIKEGLRATLYQALTSSPRTHVNVRWEPAYDWQLVVSQTPNTSMTAGVINVTLRSRYLGDPHPLQAEITQYETEKALRTAQARGGSASPPRGGARSRGRGSARPAKINPPKSS